MDAPSKSPRNGTPSPQLPSTAGTAGAGEPSPRSGASRQLGPTGSEALAALGLTALEAEAYRFILSTPQSTGYRIAQALGKPVGNIYKTIEALEQKGAILSSDDGGSRVVTAIPAEEWIRARRSAFERACAQAKSDLRTFSEAGEGDDDLVYRIGEADAAIERACAMLGTATKFVLASITPQLLPLVTDALHRCAKRGIPVGCKVFEPCDIPGVETSLDPRGMHALTNAPGQWLTMSVDGRASLQALFRLDPQRPDDPLPPLHMAIYTTNPLLAWSTYSGLSSDFLLSGVRRRLMEGGDAAAIAREMERLRRFESPLAEGKLALVRRFRSAPRRPGA